MRLVRRYAAWVESQGGDRLFVAGFLVPVLLAVVAGLIGHQRLLGIALYLVASLLFGAVAVSWFVMCWFGPVPEIEPVCPRCHGWGYTVNRDLRILEDCQLCQGDEAAPAPPIAGPRQRRSGLAEREAALPINDYR
jgi:hypothetical protein